MLQSSWLFLLTLTMFSSDLQARTLQFAPHPADLMIYEIVLDRFDNGSTNNDGANRRVGFRPKDGSGSHGGDIAGIRRRLPYIAKMGFNGIWITPFQENVKDFHGYGVYDWYNVDPNFGTLDELRALTIEARKLKIAVYYDMVVNHTGDLIGSSDNGYPKFKYPPGGYELRWKNQLRYPPPFNSLDNFHNFGHTNDYGNRFNVEKGEFMDLDDLKTEDPYVRDSLVDIWTYWMKNTYVSGFRIDTVKHVEVDFWNNFLPRLREQAVQLGKQNFYTFGEIYGANYAQHQEYVGNFDGGPYKMDAAIDFEFYNHVRSSVAENRGNIQSLGQLISYREKVLGPHHLVTPNFIDSHDVDRFLKTTTANPGSGQLEMLRRMELALLLLYTFPGPPVIYYGTEQGFNQGSIDNREDMFDGEWESGNSVGNNFNPEHRFYKYIARLGEIRTKTMSLRRGNFIHVSDSNPMNPVFAYKRVAPSDVSLVILNNGMEWQNAPNIQVPEFKGCLIENQLFPFDTKQIGDDGIFPAQQLKNQDAQLWVCYRKNVQRRR